MASIERSIQFFLLRCEEKIDGNRFQRIDPARAMREIDQLPLRDPGGGRYDLDGEGNATALIVDRSSGDEVQGKFARIRRTGLPSVERAGSVRPLEIADDEGLFEPCHFMLRDRALIAYESNYYGPRAGSMPRYLMAKSPLVDRAYLEAVLRSDWEERIRVIGEVKLLRIRMARNMEREARMLDESLGTAFAAAREAADSEEVEIVLRGRKYSRSLFGLRWLRNIRDFLLRPEARSGTTEFVIRAQNTDTGQLETFDLLQEALVLKMPVRLLPGKTRTVSSDSAHEAIRGAFRTVEPELRRVRENVPT